MAAPTHAAIKVTDLIEAYKNEHVKANSWGKTKVATLAMLQRELGGIPLVNLSALHLQDFITKRVKQGAGGATVAADLSFLGGVLKYGRVVKHLSIDPRLALDARMALTSRGLNSRSKERRREPSADELATLYAYWKRKGSRQTIPMEVICRFAMATTLRQSEITGLVAEDVDPDKKTVVVRDRKNPNEKAGNDSTIPLIGEAWSIVADRLTARRKGRIFPYDPRSVSAAFTRAVSACQIDDLHFHDLRHGAITNLFRMGLSIELVAILSGHKDWKQLRRYTELGAGDVFEAIERLNRTAQ
jgi:integrase